MPRPDLNVAAVPRTYAELRQRVTRVVLAGRREIEVAWVRTYHESGRLIHEHLLLKQARADYGAKVFRDLARDTGISERTLYECRHFFRCFPIPRHVAELGWNRCRLLCQVHDESQRQMLTAEVTREDLSSGEILRRVRALNATPAPAGTAEVAPATAGEPDRNVRRLTPKRGTPGFHRVVARVDGLAVDGGFKLYWPLPPTSLRGLVAGTIGRYEKGVFTPVADAKPADLFTYVATLRRVVDGDTLAVTISLAHGEMDEKLRLRGVDCPEMNTPAGRAAKRFVESLMERAQSVTISTSKVDKYDRYLADVFVATGAEEEVFLNNALLENGHAERKDAWEFGDWDPSAPR